MLESPFKRLFYDVDEERCVLDQIPQCFVDIPFIERFASFGVALDVVDGDLEINYVFLGENDGAQHFNPFVGFIINPDFSARKKRILVLDPLLEAI